MSSWKQAACRAISSRERVQIISSTSRGCRPEAERVATPVAMRRFRPATRTMKNSSRLLAKIARKLARSSSGVVRVLGELQHPLVEREPAAFPVEETTLRELGPVVGRLLVGVEVGVDVGLQIGDDGSHGVRAVRGYGAHGGLRVLDLGLGV